MIRPAIVAAFLGFLCSAQVPMPSPFLGGSGGGGGSGTVTLFTSGNANPIFTTSVATASTTPAQTFAINNIAAHNVLGNNTGSTAAIAAVRLACADLSDSGAGCTGSGGGSGGGVNAQTANYTLVSGDSGKLVTMNGSSITATLPASPPSATWFVAIQNLNASALTVARNGLTINGGTTNITLQQYQWTFVYTDNTNYFARPPVTAGANITLTMTSAAETLVGAAATGCTPGGGTNTLQKNNGAGGCSASSVTDNGTTVATTEQITAPSVATGSSPPSLTSGTGGAIAYGEGTGPSVCAAAAVDCAWADSTQHGFMSNFNNGGNKPLPQGPTSTTSGNGTCWNSTNGGLLSDCGFVPVTNARTVSTTSPLGGGGALSGNLTLTCTTCLTGSATNHGVALGSTAQALNFTAVGGTDKPLVGVTGADPAYSKVTLTNPATGATLTLADGKTLTVNNTMTLAGTDASTYTFPGASATITQTICSGTVALGTSAISSGAAATVVTATCTGLATTDNIMADFNADPTGTTGYAPSANGMLTIVKYPTANTINVKVVNNTGSSITPGAVTLNYRVVR